MVKSVPVESKHIYRNMCANTTLEGHILFIESFSGGSHKQLVDLLCKEIPGTVPVTLPGKKWHWKARVSALYLSQTVPRNENYRVLFASSVLNLCELVSLRPDLYQLQKVLYFHENQLIYPKQEVKDRDYQYGYNNITSCLVADVVLFNSKYNMDSFLKAVDSYLNRIPYEKPKGVSEEISKKCHVLNFPVVFPNIQDVKDSLCKKDAMTSTTSTSSASLSYKSTDRYSCMSENVEDSQGNRKRPCLEGNASVGTSSSTQKQLKPLHIVWPHRWEHDKNPAMMFRVMNKLQDVGCDFRLSVLGERYTEIPEVFVENKDKLKDKIEHWGYMESKIEYYQILLQADCVISTADHEFFGVAMLEAVHLGCFPLCPNRLVYPEIFPKECLYNTETQLYKRLREFCRKPYLVRQNTMQINTEQYSWETLKPEFIKHLTVDHKTSANNNQQTEHEPMSRKTMLNTKASFTT